MNYFSAVSRVSLLVLSLTAASQAARAEEGVATKGYVGIGGGQTSFGYDSEKCTADLGMPCDLESSDSSLKIYGGIKLSPNTAVELAYYDLGAVEGTAAAGTVTLVEEQTAISVSLVGLVPFNEQVGGIFRVGLFSANVDATATGPGGTATLSDSARNFILGLGLNANFNNNVGLRLEYEHLVAAGDSETDIGVASASLRLMF